MNFHFHFWNLCLEVVLPDGIGRVGGILKANGEVVQLSETLQDQYDLTLPNVRRAQIKIKAQMIQNCLFARAHSGSLAGS